MSRDQFDVGAAVAFGLMGMAFAIKATHDPSRHCDCGAIYSGPNAHPTMCFSCVEEQTPEWQAWAKAAGIKPHQRK